MANDAPAWKLYERLPTSDPGSWLAAGLKGTEVDAFVFQRSPQPLDEDVVHPAATPVHRDTDVGVLQGIGEGQAGELRTLIGVEDLRSAEARDGLLQRRHTELGIHRARQPPRQNLAAEPVHDRDQVQEASTHRDVGHVCTPDLVRPIDGQMAKQIWPYPMLRMRFARLRTLVDRRQTHLEHQTTNPMTPNAPTVAAQMP